MEGDHHACGGFTDRRAQTSKLDVETTRGGVAIVKFYVGQRIFIVAPAARHTPE
jgi:hypothetical protein